MVEMDYSDYTYAYIKMLLALGFIVAVLYILKRYIESKNLTTSHKTQDIKIVSQKMIDTKNRITLIRYRDREYLLLIGEKSFMIDKFDTFEKVIKDNENINNNWYFWIFF